MGIGKAASSLAAALPGTALPVQHSVRSGHHAGKRVTMCVRAYRQGVAGVDPLWRFAVWAVSSHSNRPVCLCVMQVAEWRDPLADVDMPTVPNAEYPSDHLMMAARLLLLPGPASGSSLGAGGDEGSRGRCVVA